MSDVLAIEEIREALGVGPEVPVAKLPKLVHDAVKKAKQVDELAAFRLRTRQLAMHLKATGTTCGADALENILKSLLSPP